METDKLVIVLTPMLKAYLALREQADALDEKVTAAKKAVTDALGDIEKVKVSGLTLLYSYTRTLDVEKIQAEQTKFYFECLKDPELDIPKFRKEHPDLVEMYEIKTKTRPFKVVV
jgi:hypothetical protein